MRIDDFEIFKSIPTIRTERLVLRKISKKDVDDVFEYSKDPEVSRYLLWRAHESKQQTRAYLSRVMKRYKAAQLYDWAIEYNGKMIGTCGFSRIDVLNDVAEIGYVLNRAFWGMGIATEAAKAVIEFGFRTLSLLRIEALFMEENARSLSVMKKCGMTYEGIKRSALKVDGVMRSVGTASILSGEFFGNIS